MSLTVIGVFEDATEAQQAVDQLVSAGIERSDIDLSVQSGTSSFEDERVDDSKESGSGIGHFFSSLFGDDDADKYTRVAGKGSVVTVHAQTEEQAEQAADILDDSGAVNVDERAAQYGYDSLGTGTDTISGSGAAFVDVTTRDLTSDTDQTIKVIEENLEVGKRTVETGGVRLRSRIVAKPVEESIRLREERVSVNRTPVNRPATAADLNAFQDGQIELTEHAEVPVVSKTANVVEEISVGKDVSERDEVIRDTVRKTEVDVENLGSSNPTSVPTGTPLSDDDTVTYATK